MDDKVMVITGASSGIGLATATLAAEAGWRLVLAARSEDKLEAAVAACGGPGRALAVRCDVTSHEDQTAMAAAALDTFGRIDVVFANAGRGGSPGGFTGADPAHWRDILMTNVYGVALTCQVTIPALKASQGQIVLTGSRAGRRTIAGSMYSTSKWAVSAIGYGLREELAGTGIRVTLLEPGMVDTPFFDAPKPDALTAADVARTVLHAVSQPAGVELHEIMILPTPPAR